jgi:hypothetical protein
VSDDTSWDDRLRAVLTEDWQSSELLAAKLHAKPFTVLARLKDMMRRNLVERRLVNKTQAIPSGKGRVGKATQTAQFRRTPLGRTPPG